MVSSSTKRSGTAALWRQVFQQVLRRVPQKQAPGRPSGKVGRSSGARWRWCGAAEHLRYVVTFAHSYDYRQRFYRYWVASHGVDNRDLKITHVKLGAASSPNKWRQVSPIAPFF